MIVPDTIEPYIGYKALTIAHNLKLQSPTYPIEWPIGERLEAICADPHWGWYPQSIDQLDEHALLQADVADKVGAAPRYVPLPPGYVWCYMPIPHKVADSGCSCGIYAVAEKENTFGYLHPTGIVAQVALWGQITIGGNGARGQYAYPQKLWVPPRLAGIGYEVAAKYGITAEPQQFETGRGGIHITHLPSEAEKNAREASFAFAILASLFSALNITHLLLGRNGPGWVGPTLTFIALALAALSIWATTDAIRLRRKG